MTMFCYQCQEAAKNTGCTLGGVCGKKSDTAAWQDLLIDIVKHLSEALGNAKNVSVDKQRELEEFILDALFTTITNANFDNEAILAKIKQGLTLGQTNFSDKNYFMATDLDQLFKKAQAVSVLSTVLEDIRSLRELLVYGIKGIAAYAQHAYKLGYFEANILRFITKGLAATLDNNLKIDDLIALVLECGHTGVAAMSLLDKANTETFGHPELTRVNLGAGKNPGILVSGHDLRDLSELLEQTKDSGVDIYTHSEMLPANSYPAFKKYKHFFGNYGNSWWRQAEEFEKFNGPILMTTNCIVPPRESYKHRMFTTGSAGYPEVTHIEDGLGKQPKNFTKIIEMAKDCLPPQQLESGTIVTGFAHHQILALADKVKSVIESGAIKKFVVMAGCDGRLKSRQYYTDFAQALPKDTVILTAGCAKYRYNKLNLGEIGGIPRVLDAGQCNDSYSLVKVALELQKLFGLKDINELPIVYNIAWYEQKAVIVLLALLSLGVKNIKLGPTLPAFISPNVYKVIKENFNLTGITSVAEDFQALMLSPAKVS